MRREIKIRICRRHCALVLQAIFQADQPHTTGKDLGDMYVAVQLENDLLSAGARKLLLFTKLIPYRVQHAPEGLGDLAKRLTWHGINTTTRIGANDSHRTLASCCWEQRPSSALICSYSAASATSRCARRSSAASRPHWSGTPTVRYSWFTKELADFLSDL